MRLLLILILLTTSACQFAPSKKPPPAGVKDISINEKINPKNTDKSIIETLPRMNEGAKSLYNDAKKQYQNNAYKQAIGYLERAYAIQPTSPQISQLMAEIYLQQGKHKQAHYWATIATQNGPARGEICEKSWRILALSAEQLGYDANQAMALEKQVSCLVIQPNRY